MVMKISHVFVVVFFVFVGFITFKVFDQMSQGAAFEGVLKMSCISKNPISRFLCLKVKSEIFGLFWGHFDTLVTFWDQVPNSGPAKHCKGSTKRKHFSLVYISQLSTLHIKSVIQRKGQPRTAHIGQIGKVADCNTKSPLLHGA